MVEILTPVDVVDVVIRYLTPLLPGVEVTGGVTPTEFATSSVHVIRTGGGVRDLVTDHPIISIDSRHLTSEIEADLVARRVHALMTAAERVGVMAGTPVYEVTPMTGPYDNPDPTHPSLFRVTCTYMVSVRMTASTASIEGE